MNENEVFARVIEEADHALREKLLEQLCEGDDELQHRVRHLLVAYDAPDSFLADPVEARLQRNLDQTTIGFAQAGRVIGPYKLLQQIGEGGMGLVFMAEQTEPVKRRVALKIIKPGMDSKQVIARFEAERQAIAMMDHPNIAKVFEAGATEHGDPYFVMELVNGLPITDYCDQEKLSTDKRLQIFGDVCRAVQHAHQKGIIHRDLKPNNILVAEYDGRPVPKVIDFGVAKATGVQLTEKTLFTGFGQVIGTLEYMSPEQSRRNQLDVDTRSDIYSLGVVLYKLLTGETPFGEKRLQQVALDEMLKMIREEPVPRPSEKIGSSQSLKQVAIDRSVDPSKLSAQVQGDLDWIVLKTLEKNRNHRYASADALADDIQRHLDQHPIAARPSSAWDRLGKYSRRNPRRLKAYAALFAAFVLLLMLGMQAAGELKTRTARLAQADSAARVAIARAEAGLVTDKAGWESASAQCELVRDMLTSWKSDGEVEAAARKTLAEFENKKTKWQLAVQIEETLIANATMQELASWQAMEQQMREFFRENGFDLDQDKPADIGARIRDDANSEQWADLLELWIGTRAHMSMMGGPPINQANMQPWADAIYVADEDPIRTGIRRFIYTPPYKREKLEELATDIDLAKLSPRTLAWLASTWAMVGAISESDAIFEKGLELYPQDVMLAHDYGFHLHQQQRYQEAARIFHRCLALRSNVAGLWHSLAKTLQALGEQEASAKAMTRARALESPSLAGP